MKLEKAAACLAELGHAKRLEIFKLLVSCGKVGIETGKIAEKLSIPNSTLSHHLRKLANVDLITQIQEHPKIFCKPNCDVLQQVLSYLTKNCCEKPPSRS